MNRFKVFLVVELVKACEFNFCVFDVVENLEGVLRSLGYSDVLDYEDYYGVMDELLPIAEEGEFSEISGLVFAELSYWRMELFCFDGF